MLSESGKQEYVQNLQSASQSTNIGYKFKDMISRLDENFKDKLYLSALYDHEDRALNSVHSPQVVDLMLKTLLKTGSVDFVNNKISMIAGGFKIEGMTYKVKSGDTLSSIAKKHKISLDELIKANPQITNPNRINEKQEINLPDHAIIPSDVPVVKAKPVVKAEPSGGACYAPAENTCKVKEYFDFESYIPQMTPIPLAKIEVFTRDIDLPNAILMSIRKILGADYVPQHGFIIHTDSYGKQVLYRAGPKHAGFASALIDDLTVVKIDYIERNKNECMGDYFKPNEIKNLPSKLQFSGSNAAVQAIIDKMWLKGQEINQGKFDYKIPFGHVQNSNTVVKLLHEAGGIKFVVPEVNGKPVSMPGINGRLDHTFGDFFAKEYKGE